MMTPAMALALQANFGSVENWQTRHETLGREGPVQLSFVPATGALVQHLAAESPPGALPLLEAHLGASIAWETVYTRYQDAVHDASAPWGAAAEDIADALLIDVRRSAIYEQADSSIPGSQWRDPAEVGAWSATLPTGQAVVVYCIYGHEVGRATALRLRARGVVARFLVGGIDAWKAAGRPLQAKKVLS